MKKNPMSNFYQAFRTICFLAFTLLCGSRSYSQIIGEKDSKLTANDLTISSNFKASVGQNRIALFDQIKPLINSVDANGNTTEATSSNDLVQLLGEPDIKIQQSIYQYNLNQSASSCKAIIGISKEGLVTFCVVKDCQ